MKNMNSLCLGHSYTYGNGLRSIKTGSWSVFQTKEALKMVFGIHSIKGVFTIFRWIPIMIHYRGS